MSDIEVVSADVFRNGYAPEGHVPYGTVFVDDDDDQEIVPSEAGSFESMFEGAVASRSVPGKRGPGRPRKDA